MAADTPRQLQRRRRTKYNKDQYKVLTEAFERSQYPGINVREELARLTQIPEPRIQVWFQNRRAQILKRSRRSSSRKAAWAQVPAPGPTQPGVSAFNYSGQEGLLGTPREMDHFSWELECASGQTVLWGHAGMPGLETPACMWSKPSGNLWGSLISNPAGFSPPAFQPLFPQLDAGGTGTQVCMEAPGLLPPGDWVLHGQEQCHCSGELQSGVPSGYLGPWEQSMPSPPRQFCLHPASFPLLWPQPQPVKGPTECWDQLPPPSGDLHGALECPASRWVCTASCCHCKMGNDLSICLLMRDNEPSYGSTSKN